MWNRSASSVIEASWRPRCSSTPRRVESASARNADSSWGVLILNHQVQYEVWLRRWQVPSGPDPHRRRPGDDDQAEMAEATVVPTAARRRRALNRLSSGVERATTPAEPVRFRCHVPHRERRPDQLGRATASADRAASRAVPSGTPSPVHGSQAGPAWYRPFVAGGDVAEPAGVLPVAPPGTGPDASVPVVAQGLGRRQISAAHTGQPHWFRRSPWPCRPPALVTAARVGIGGDVRHSPPGRGHGAGSPAGTPTEACHGGSRRCR